MVRFRERTAAFMAAMERAVALNRRLVVIGDPDAGFHTRLARAYGCGDVCVDLNGCPKCPMTIVADITNGPIAELAPRFGGAAEVEKSHLYIKGYRGKTVSGDKRRAIPLHVHDEGVRSRSDADLTPPLLTVQDLAVLLATSSRGVYSRVARGQISGALRIGRSIRFDPRVIAQWLSANKASAGGLP